MTRIESTFETLKSQNKKALIPYVMAGDPNPTTTVGLLHDLVKHGADMIEVGLPFSDPMADGPTVALAGERALAADDEHISNPEKWRGLNLLGFALMAVRDKLND